MPIPGPQERPDLYDDYDGRPDGPKPGEQQYWDSVVPDHIKQALAEKQGAKPANPEPAKAPAQNEQNPA